MKRNYCEGKMKCEKSLLTVTHLPCAQVWSEVNQAVLDYENRESTPKLAKLLKLLLWAQNELDQKKVKYPKMTDLSTGTIEDPK